MQYCIAMTLGKTLDAVSHLGQAVYPLWWPAWRKTCKQNSFFVGVVWQDIV